MDTSPVGKAGPAAPARGRGRAAAWVKKGLSALLVLAVVLLGAGLIYQAVGAAVDARRYLPPGQLTNVGDYNLHINCTGQGSPTVVLETGAGGTSLNWAWVQPELAQSTRVCSYDRAGRGWSDHGAPSRDMWGTAEDLYTLLRTTGIEGPYVLVGHSIGGLYVRAFTDQHPDEVAGMVLLDSVHPEKYDRYPEYAEQDEQYARFLATFPTLARVGLFRFYFATGGEIDFQELPPRQHDELAAFWSSPAYFHSVQSEGRLARLIHEQGEALGDLGDMPLAVITAGINDSSWLVMQEELPLLSTNSTHLTMSGATHSSLMFNPDHAHQTSEAILQVVVAARNGR